MTKFFYFFKVNHCKHCASPISHSEFGIKNQMCDLCIAELVADQYAYENE